MAGSISFSVLPAWRDDVIVTITKVEARIGGAWVDYTGASVTEGGESNFASYAPGVGYVSAPGEWWCNVHLDALPPATPLPTQIRITVRVSEAVSSAEVYANIYGEEGAAGGGTELDLDTSPAVVTFDVERDFVGAPWQPSVELPIEVTVTRPVMDFVQIHAIVPAGSIIVTKIETEQAGEWTDRTGEPVVPAPWLGGLVEYGPDGYVFGDGTISGVPGITTLSPSHITGLRVTWYRPGPGVTIGFGVVARSGAHYSVGLVEEFVSSAGSSAAAPIVTMITGLDFTGLAVSDDEPIDGYIALPVSVSVSAPLASRVELPIRLQVAAPALIELPVQLQVAAHIAPPGAAPWPAAPGGAWRAVVVLGSADISAQLSGRVSVSHGDNQAAIAEFSMLPTAAPDLDLLVGRPVRIAFAAQANPVAHTIYTGVVDVAAIDINTGIVTCRCHDQLQERASNLSRAWIDAEVGGSWHVAIDGEPENSRDYLEQCIQSVPASYAIDPLGTFRVLPWRGAGLRHEMIAAADCVDGSLSLDMPRRGEMVTRVEVRSEYRYERLRARGALAQYQQPIAFYQPLISPSGAMVRSGKQMLMTAMVQGATDSIGGWILTGREIDHPPARNWNLGTGLDPYNWFITAAAAPSFALGFRAWFATRWTQTVTEDYTLTVVCTALEDRLGIPVSEQIGASLQAEFDGANWSSDASITPLAITDRTRFVGDRITAHQPAGAAPADRDALLRALLDRARTRIHASTRTGRAAFELPLRPDMWLDWHVTLESSRVRVAGKVAKVSHEMDIGSGAAITSAELVFGLPGNADAERVPWVLPATPHDSYSPPASAFSCEIGTFVGGGVSSAPWDDSAMIGFSTNYQQSGEESDAYEFYPHQLRVQAPALAAEDRDPRDLPVAAQYEIDIPTDLLEMM
ncbi:hypothetical protein [Thauera butanivorans]|uniref:hypothetical protein n=1 Tax=Thauera butanivorans TaxID=86174 RepID=UPI0008398311|nr:hypothetical protein [Thauera butanivorans]